MVDDVRLDLDATAHGEIRVTLMSPSWLLHIEAPRADLERLAGIADADWNARRSLAVGTCMNSSVYWSADPDPNAADQATLLIGHDAETWDIGITVPQTTVRKIAELAAQFPGA
ncbi:hypothetical protein GCM10027176_21690 [Actinoallomurus bryophytorum]|uniref:Uncharacterized protein n=1 Tax=Actinoallomurus bryophytorum TaxID=1490222 RepID=A0A543CKD2_9ACTN|nr:hypothetical protein [Actinoallomurus bryophytorum]TQL97562.1 hypothetical protein FB559_3156 [Actinoallomurus bryophytorum]